MHCARLDRTVSRILPAILHLRWQFTGRKWAHKKIKRNPRLSESDRRGFSLNLFRGPWAPNAQGNALQSMPGGRRANIDGTKDPKG